MSVILIAVVFASCVAVLGVLAFMAISQATSRAAARTVWQTIFSSRSKAVLRDSGEDSFAAEWLDTATCTNSRTSEDAATGV